MRTAPALAAALLLALAPAAAAHPLLLDSTPADGARGAAPARLVLRFNGRVEPTLSPVTLTGGPGHRRTRLRPEPAERPEVLTFPLPALEPGAYRVEWKALSVDGHLTDGVVRFTVVSAPRRGPAPTPGGRR